MTSLPIFFPVSSWNSNNKSQGVNQVHFGFLVTYWYKIMENMKKKNPERRVTRMVQGIVGCKWSLHILEMIRKGVCRPGALSRSIEGLSTKVLNERLTKMMRFGIIEKHSYPEIPPRVEYALTDFGRRIAVILDAIETLQEEIDSETGLDKELRS